ncbi:MAG: menaquinone biosynthesis protein [Blastochloris sp.]|nr:menaquinone biosynthesis protein [Blastochloris sp.]
MAPELEKLRIGSVPYLNAAPLLRHLPDRVTLMEPSLLAQAFRRREFDLALIPVVELFLEKEGAALDGIGIACQGPVYSVILVHDKSLDQIKRIALDVNSLTSATLLKVLVRKHWKIEVEFLPEGEEAEARLLIGDRALEFRRQNPEAGVTDLGAAWRAYTGLPFVFAVWALNPETKFEPGCLQLFFEACRKGLAERAYEAKTEEEYQYLTEWIRYEIGPFEKEAVRRFAEELGEPGSLSWVPGC